MSDRPTDVSTECHFYETKTNTFDEIRPLPTTSQSRFVSHLMTRARAKASKCFIQYRRDYLPLLPSRAVASFLCKSNTHQSYGPTRNQPSSLESVVRVLSSMSRVFVREIEVITLSLLC